MKEPVPKKLAQAGQAGQDGALLWSSGDQKAAPPAPPAPREAAFPKDQIFQLSSHQVTKVKALRIVGRSGWGAVAMLSPHPHRRAL